MLGAYTATSSSTIYQTLTGSRVVQDLNFKRYQFENKQIPTFLGNKIIVSVISWLERRVINKTGIYIDCAKRKNLARLKQLFPCACEEMEVFVEIEARFLYNFRFRLQVSLKTRRHATK